MNFDRLPKAACRVHCRSETGLGVWSGVGDIYTSTNQPVAGEFQERVVFLGSLKAVTPELDGKPDRL